MIRATGPAPARILGRCTSDASGCLLWQGGQDARGYGMMHWQGRAHYVHRLVYEGLVGPIPSGHVVRHRCDTPLCCNPEHLITGTKGDNIRDAFDRGQLKRKLSPESVEALRQGKLTIQEAVELTGVSWKHAYNVKLGHKR